MGERKFLFGHESGRCPYARIPPFCNNALSPADPKEACPFCFPPGGGGGSSARVEIARVSLFY